MTSPLVADADGGAETTFHPGAVLRQTCATAGARVRPVTSG
jgi:hypothetical protein